MSYPDIQLEQDIIEKLMRFFDLDINETFFEIILINKHKRIINLFFELPSEWARGKTQLAMLSLIMKEKYDSRMIYTFLVDAVQKIISTENVFKAFYKSDDFQDNDIGIDLGYEAIKKVLFNCLSSLIKRLKSKT
ncbi:MAG: hypothetical protein ACFFDO_09320 [Candidatus Thorarchaeota archaeon]